MAKDAGISNRLERVDEIIEQLDTDECDHDKGDALYKEGRRLLVEVRDRPNDGSGNIVVLKQDAVDGRKSTNMTGQPLICWLRA